MTAVSNDVAPFCSASIVVVRREQMSSEVRAPLACPAVIAGCYRRRRRNPPRGGVVADSLRVFSGPSAARQPRPWLADDDDDDDAVISPAQVHVTIRRTKKNVYGPSREESHTLSPTSALALHACAPLG